VVGCVWPMTRVLRVGKDVQENGRCALQLGARPGEGMRVPR
jgi:hypothetical protein